MGEDLVEPVLDSINETGGGWPVLVLVIVIAAIVYLARYVLSRQMRAAEERAEEQARVTAQRIADRKAEFAAQLQRERDNANNYQATTVMMVDAFNKNAAAMSDFTAVLRPMGDTLTRIDQHIQRQNFEQRRKGGE